jgi:hypothetical protein
MPILFPTSPTVGQVFTSGGRSWVWSGATWDSPTATNTLLAPYGLELIASTGFFGQATLQLANVFSTTYQHYRLIYRMNANASSVSARMMTGTTPTSGGTDYTWSRGFWTGTSGFSNNGGSTGGSNFTIISQSAGGPSTGYVDIYQPFLALPTMFNGMSQYATLGELLVARHGLSNSYTGLQLDSAAGAMTGSIQIYGYRSTL